MGKLKKINLCVMLFFLGFLVEPDISSARTTNVTWVDDCTELNNIVKETWSDDFFGCMILRDNSSEIEVDGRRIAVKDIFNIESRGGSDESDIEEREELLLRNRTNDTIYEIIDAGDFIKIMAPYQTKRLIIKSTKLSDYYGAESAYCCEETNETYLQYLTEEETKNAYEKITALYGDDFCFVDEVVCIDDFSSKDASESDVYSWGVRYMGMDTLKKLAETKTGLGKVKVAVIDTGICASNFMFKNRTITADSFNFSAQNTSDNYLDTNGHGTHVSGTIVEATPQNVEIMSLKVGNDYGIASSSMIRNAIIYAVEHGASCINISMGQYSSSQKFRYTYDDAIQKAYDRNIPICVAAGNDSADAKYAYPAENVHTITVGALGESFSLATYSNRGDLIDFVAPGSNIVSADYSGDTVSMDGTSMACPHITAAVAYIKMIDPNLTVSEVYDTLKFYAEDLGDSGKDNLYGWGCPKVTYLFEQGVKKNPGNDLSDKSVADKGEKSKISASIKKKVTRPSILKVKSKAKGRMTVKWSKNNVSGYQLQYGKKKNFIHAKKKTISGKKMQVTIKKLLKGRYYVRIRAYIETSAGRVYSKWSSKKKIKIS